MDRHSKLLVYLSLLAALCCVATMVIPIPTPTGGYLSAGDIVVVFSALLAGPVYGSIAMGLGSGMADLCAGYAIYAPGTLLAKGLSSVIIGLLYRRSKQDLKHAAFSAVCGELTMAGIYFLYEALCLGFGWGAAVEIPGNLLQGAAGVVGGTALYQALQRVPEIQKFQELTY